MESEPLFENYLIIHREKTVKISALLEYKGLEKMGMIIIDILPSIIIYYLPLGGSWQIFGIKIILMVILFLILKKYSQQLMAKPILEIDSDQHMLNSLLDKSQIALASIQKIDVIEETIQDNTDQTQSEQYRLQLTVNEEKMMLPFAFTTAKKLQEIQVLIK